MVLLAKAILNPDAGLQNWGYFTFDGMAFFNGVKPHFSKCYPATFDLCTYSVNRCGINFTDVLHLVTSGPRHNDALNTLNL